jgi:hypothetical protein
MKEQIRLYPKDKTKTLENKQDHSILLVIKTTKLSFPEDLVSQN